MATDGDTEVRIHVEGEWHDAGEIVDRIDDLTTALDSAADALDEISRKAGAAQRQGGPDPDDVENLSDSLSEVEKDCDNASFEARAALKGQ
jgi:hypothetical protein